MNKSFSIKRVIILLILSSAFIILPIVTFILGVKWRCGITLDEAKTIFMSESLSLSHEALTLFEKGNQEAALRKGIQSLCQPQMSTIGCQFMGVYLMKHSDPCLAIPWFDEAITMQEEHQFDNEDFWGLSGELNELKTERTEAITACQNKNNNTVSALEEETFIIHDCRLQ